MQDTLKSFGAAQWGGGAPSVQIMEHDQRYINKYFRYFLQHSKQYGKSQQNIDYVMHVVLVIMMQQKKHWKTVQIHLYNFDWH